MSLINGLLSGASEIDQKQLEAEFNVILIDGEQIDKAFKVIRDLFVFTSKRLIMVDKQGITGKKKEYHSIPYKSISHFSVETSGHFDMDSELKIWVSGSDVSIKKDFSREANIIGIQKTLARYILK